MNHLVLTVSLDSSIELLRQYADIVILDKETAPDLTKAYDSVYIRSHFSTPALMPQTFSRETEQIVSQAKQLNPETRFVDNMDNVDTIVAFEDKWSQYELFGECMPHSEIFAESVDTDTYTRPIFKSRMSSRSRGVTWNEGEADRTSGDWIIQESLDIHEELRIYAVCGEIYAVAAVRQNMTTTQRIKVINYRELSQTELDFSKKIIDQDPNLDFLGLDIARTSGGELRLIEVNRSPGFSRFHELSGVNLAQLLYEKLLNIKVQ